MLKLLLGVVGLAEALYPDQFIRLLTKYSYEYDEAPTAKPWVITAARIEGLAILGIVLYSAMKSDCSCRVLCSENGDNETESVDRID